MARYFEEENNEDEEVVVRLRRRPLKKPVVENDDDEDERGNRRNNNNNPNDEDEEEEELLPSTGFVFLDIVLDYWDDYIYWTKEHFLVGIILGVLCFLAFFAPISLITLYIYNYIHRPTLQKALDAYDFGAYGEAGKFAETVLKYTARGNYRSRAGALFVLGASACSIAEMTGGKPNDPQKKNYYLVAAKYLSDCRDLGYYPGRKAEAAFMLGKSFYFAEEFAKVAEPLLVALENNTPNKKMLYWFLANSYLFAPNTNTAEAEKFVQLFRNEETVTDEELFEADLLGSMIQIYNNNPDAAEQILRKVPQFDQYATMKTFINGQIAFLRANMLRAKSLSSERQFPTNNNPPTIPNLDNPNLDNFPNPSLLPDNNSSLHEPKKMQDNFALQSRFPRGVIATRPIDFDDDSNSIYRRITYLVQNESNNSTAAPISESESVSEPAPASDLDSASESDLPSTPPASSDAIILLPPDPAASRPSETDLNLSPSDEMSTGDFLPPTGIDAEFMTGDPFTSEAKKFKELAQQKYREAIEYFREVRRNDLFEQRWLRTAELLEGKCNEEIGEIKEAKIRYQQVSEIFPETDEAAAADFFYAELERGMGRFEGVLSIYDRAFEVLQKNSDYACHWLTRKDITQKTIEILQWLMRQRNYRTGIIFLSLVRDTIRLPDIAKFRGEFYESWGNELYQQSLTQKEQQHKGGERESGYIEKFRRAGEAFSELARYQFGEPTYNQQVWRSAENFRLGKDNKRGIEAYKVYLRVNKVDRQIEALLYIGEMYINLAMIDDAIANLENAIAEYPNDALISRIRFTLSHAYNEKRDFDKAKQLLISNLVESSYDPSSIVYRDSVYLLAKLSFERGNTDDVIVYIEDALKTHPNAPQAAEGHYFISQSYLARAESTLGMMKDAAQINEVRTQIQTSVLNDRTLALEHIQTAERLLLQYRNNRDLSESELIMLKNTMFGAGKIMMLLGQYEKAIATFNMVATRYQEPTSLDALLQIALAYRYLNRKDDAISVLNRAELLLQQFEESGTIPKGTDWMSKIQIQKKVMNNE